jgi:hypothetical protein
MTCPCIPSSPRRDAVKDAVKSQFPALAIHLSAARGTGIAGYRYRNEPDIGHDMAEGLQSSPRVPPGGDQDDGACPALAQERRGTGFQSVDCRLETGGLRLES